MHRPSRIVILCLVSLSPCAIADDILVGCWASGDVRRYGTDGTYKGLFAPHGTLGLQTPDGLALHPSGDVLVSSAEQGAVLRFSRDGTPLGVFTSENITRAGFCTYGPDGRFYVCDAGTNTVKRFDGVTGSYLDTFVTSANTTIYPAGLSWSNGTLFVSCFSSNRVNRYDAATGAFLGSIGTNLQPLYTRVGSDGLLAVAEFGLSRISKYNPTTGQFVSVFNAGMNGPVGQLVLPDGSLIVSSWNNHKLLHYTSDAGVPANPLTFATLPTSANPNDLLLLPSVPSTGAGAVAILGPALLAVRRRRK